MSEDEKDKKIKKLEEELEELKKSIKVLQEKNRNKQGSNKQEYKNNGKKPHRGGKWFKSRTQKAFQQTCAQAARATNQTLSSLMYNHSLWIGNIASASCAFQQPAPSPGPNQYVPFQSNHAYNNRNYQRKKWPKKRNSDRKEDEEQKDDEKK